MNKRLKIRPTLCAMSSLRASQKTSPLPTLRGSIMVSVRTLLDYWPLDIHKRRPICRARMRGHGQLTCVCSILISCLELSRRAVRPAFASHSAIRNPNALPSGYACRAHQLGIHGRYPARSRFEVLLHPCQLDHHHRFVAQSWRPARPAEKTFRSWGTRFRSGLCLGAHGVSSLSSGFGGDPGEVSRLIPVWDSIHWAPGKIGIGTPRLARRHSMISVQRSLVIHLKMEPAWCIFQEG